MTLLENICKVIGKQNNPLYTVVPIAICKGIFRPIFTLSDKKQEPESKKYAAVREGTTELVAIPTYICMSKLTEKLAPAFSPEGKSVEKILKNSKTTLGFFGICLAALVVIPELCNLVMPHVLKLFKTKDKSPQNQPFTTETQLAFRNMPKYYQYMQVYNPYITSMKNNNNSGGGMKI